MSLLFLEHPLVVNPPLAKLLSLNEAIILQQIHYWVEINRKAGRNFEDGHFWTFNTYEEWQGQFPFWSVMTIRRAIGRLEARGLLVTDNFNKKAIDQTKWYRINYEALDALEEKEGYEQTMWSKRTAHLFKMNRPIPETTPEITTTTTRVNTLPEIGEVYRDNIGEVTPIVFDELAAIAEAYSLEWFKAAVREAASCGKCNLKYIKAILNRWHREGFQSDKREARSAPRDYGPKVVYREAKQEPKPIYKMGKP